MGQIPGSFIALLESNYGSVIGALSLGKNK